MTRTLPILALLLLLPSCWINRRQTNEPLPPEVVGAIEPGVTTAGEVVARLGAPTEVVQLGRRSAYRFDHTTEKAALLWLGVAVVGNTDSRQDRVWVWFDERDVVSHVASTFQAGEARYAMPWTDRE